MDFLQKNADRFTGFANLYDDARPTMPLQAAELIEHYLGGPAKTVIDFGCGTGLSTLIWNGRCNRVIGIEPSDDMRAVAESKHLPYLTLRKTFAHNTGLESGCADAIICSQSFHWMEPSATLREAARLLRDGGVFATVDCDWPPVSDWQVEQLYESLFVKIRRLEESRPGIRDSFHRYPKSRHLENIRSSGQFRYVREIVFSSEENCSADRLIRLTHSQGGVQAVLRLCPEEISDDLAAYEKRIRTVFGERSFAIRFSYRMRLGIK